MKKVLLPLLLILVFSDISMPQFGQQTTFCRNQIGKVIYDHSTVLDTIIVSLGFNHTVIDINVKIDTLTHTWDNDLTFYIRKGTTGVKIINRVGSSGDNFIGTILNDSAAIPIASGTPPFTGSFIPSFPLTPFSGMPTDGAWILRITDTANGDTGMLKAWCLIMSYYWWDGGIHTVVIPSYYALNQNYPNPFNPVTTISYAIPEAGNVKLIIYDILGREMAILVNEFKQAGIYDMKFDASNLSSGVYFYRIETKDFTQTKKMLFIK